MSYDNLFHGGKTEGKTQVDNHTQWHIQAENLLADRDIWHPTIDKKFPLGAIADSRDGRRWRYCENGAADLAVALLNCSSSVVTDWELIAKVPAVAVKAKSFTINSALGTALVSGDLIDGYLTVEDAAGEGNMYLIKDHTIGTLQTIHLADSGGIMTAWESATTEITLTKNKYKDVIICAIDATGVITGVNMTAVTTDYFFWSQVRGPCPVKDSAGTDTVVVGDMVMAGAVTAGTVGIPDGDATDVLVGYCISAAATNSDYNLIDLNIE